ncbi:MAG: ATP phosphoribosyltransferase regulatory subunit [Lachnospiraceae bacterium]|uniref:ATP phosphoribosyltransferase regulatory subunit n=1 Tax=Candidatus Weimeria bifida TaxID=2599074 RepID=A0A6N7J039_9FIRM|nr:ATP phosphoribosyltransferase regulatory subunit [Candidatus Weimeria bifida]RRF96974.1 MAG: ATP phosphoribosyltransferase regulatory subunit [Lachnospiraceae bacterium]
MNSLLHTPEGVRDILGDECRRRNYVMNALMSLLNSYGYDQIETPCFEFLDTYSESLGSTPERDLFRFFDRDGNTLALRPDFTPSVARVSSRYFSDTKETLRVCYEGKVFLNHHSLRGELSEQTQVGAELIGDSSINSDAEIISLIVHGFLSCGLKNFQISIGHADIFNGLIEAAGFSAEEEADVHDFVSNKNFYGLDEYLSGKNISKDLVSLFGLLSKIFMTPDEWKDSLEKARNYPKIYGALSHLYEMNELLSAYGVEDYVSFDLGLVRSLKYYTGIIFSGYTFGSGKPIVTGGRYDNLLGHFGADRPAIGFAFLINELMLSIERQHIDLPVESAKILLLYPKDSVKAAIKKAEALRKAGNRVLLHSYNDRDHHDRLCIKYASYTIMETGDDK